MSRCSICKLESDRRAAIDDALRNKQASLQEIAEASGLSRSSLHRHRQHLASLEVSEHTLPTTDGAISQPKREMNFRQSLPPVKPERKAVPDTNAEPADSSQGPSRQELLQRIEYLWRESLDGLAASKEPLKITRPDGTVVEVSSDLRVRPAFLREARAALELQGTATGQFATASPIGPIYIVMPQPSEARRKDHEMIIDLPLPRRDRH